MTQSHANNVTEYYHYHFFPIRISVNGQWNVLLLYIRILKNNNPARYHCYHICKYKGRNKKVRNCLFSEFQDTKAEIRIPNKYKIDKTIEKVYKNKNSNTTMSFSIMVLLVLIVRSTLLSMKTLYQKQNQYHYTWYRYCIN